MNLTWLTFATATAMLFSALSMWASVSQIDAQGLLSDIRGVEIQHAEYQTQEKANG